MNPSTFHFWASAVFATLFFVFMPACSTRKPVEVAIPDASEVIAGAKFTEATVLGEAADVRLQLKAAVEASVGTTAEPAVREAAAKVEASLAEVEAVIAANPAAKVEETFKKLYEAIAELRKVIASRDAEIQSLKDANARTWHWILYGGAVFCTLAAVASGFFASSIPVIGPYLGPRMGVLFGALAGALYVLGYLYDWTRAHPVYTGIGVALLLGGALGLAWANKVGHDTTSNRRKPNLTNPPFPATP
jgi:hypothetical protein